MVKGMNICLLKYTAKKYHLNMVLLHGSYAEGKEHPGSDLDIAVVTKKEMSAKKLLDMQYELTKIFGNNKSRELDLKILKNPSPLFLYEVTRKNVLLYGDRNEYDELRAYAFKYYHDAGRLFTLEAELSEKLQKKLNKAYA